MKILAILLLLSISAVANADYVSAIPTSIETGSGGIIVNGPFATSSYGCAKTGAVIILDTHSHHAFLQSAALAALMGKKKLTYFIVGCDSNTGYMQVYERLAKIDG